MWRERWPTTVWALEDQVVEEINLRGQSPVIFGISFGCGLIRAFLHSAANEPSLRIRGVAMTSPVLCTEDLVRTERDKKELKIRLTKVGELFADSRSD